MKGQGEAINPNLNVDGERLVAQGYVTDVLTDYTVDFMRRSRGKPFMVFLAHKALHPNVQQRDDGSVAQLQNQSGGFRPGRSPSRSLCNGRRPAPPECDGAGSSGSRRCSARYPDSRH